jgi:hypothetical protein
VTSALLLFQSEAIARFVKLTVDDHLNRNSRLNNRPSPFWLLRSAKSHPGSAKRYVFATLISASACFYEKRSFRRLFLRMFGRPLTAISRL